MKHSNSINLRGPQGNAFYLIGTARSLGRQLGWDEEQNNAVIADMQSGDYAHLVKVFKEHFGRLVTLVPEDFGEE